MAKYIWLLELQMPRGVGDMDRADVPDGCVAIDKAALTIDITDDSFYVFKLRGVEKVE